MLSRRSLLGGLAATCLAPLISFRAKPKNDNSLKLSFPGKIPEVFVRWEPTPSDFENRMRSMLVQWMKEKAYWEVPPSDYAEPRSLRDYRVRNVECGTLKGNKEHVGVVAHMYFVSASFTPFMVSHCISCNVEQAIQHNVDIERVRKGVEDELVKFGNFWNKEII